MSCCNSQFAVFVCTFLTPSFRHWVEASEGEFSGKNFWEGNSKVIEGEYTVSFSSHTLTAFFQFEGILEYGLH